MHIEDVLQRFLVQLDADGRAESTRAQYKRHVGLLGAWLAGEYPDLMIEQLTHEHVARFFTSDAGRRRADGQTKRPTSLNCLRSSIRGFFGYANRCGIVATNAAALLRRAVCSTPPPRAMRQDDLARLLDAMRKSKTSSGRRDHCLFRLIATTGLRLRSALAIRIDDIDLGSGEVLLHNFKGGRQVVAYLPGSIRAELRVFIGSRTTGWLFPGINGKPLSGRHTHRRLQQWLARAGITRHCSSHSLRHSFAVRLYGQTHDLLLVKEALHHKSIASTMIYATVDRERLKRALG